MDTENVAFIVTGITVPLCLCCGLQIVQFCPLIRPVVLLSVPCSRTLCTARVETVRVQKKPGLTDEKGHKLDS